MTLLIDNYDSFSYNLYQFIGVLDPEIRVIRNDELTVKQIADLRPNRIILSPGPGRPAAAGVCKEAVRQLAGYIPILGVCLGHQAICEVYGATITYAKQLMHGKQSDAILDTSSPLFRSLPETIPVGRYHSLAADPATIPSTLRVLARAPDGEIMAVQYADYPVFGLQFHPESILTPSGETILRNFMELTR
jgi:anthranilate synthase component 2